MNVTLKHIADELGLSPATVSLALRNKKAGKKPLSPRTVAAVQEAARRLGYRPNVLAQNLAGQRSTTIGVLLSSLIFGSEAMLDGINAGLGDDFTLLLSVYNRDAKVERREIGVFIGNRVGGIIVAPSADPDNLDIYKEIVESHKMPLVLLSRRVPGIEAPVVRADHFAATYEATKALLALGHRRILYGGVSFSKWVDTHVMFIDGHTQAMRQAGLENELRVESRTGVQDWVKPAQRHQEAGRILDKWAGEKDRATAILVDSDWLAYEILDECGPRGIRVPDDISLMGIGDYHLSLMSYVGLSSVGTLGESSTQAAMGVNAARLLQDLMAGKQWDGKDIILPVDVRMRKTTRQI
jgi:DNA-binding LacI/PurR family transcriptional regulator